MKRRSVQYTTVTASGGTERILPASAARIGIFIGMNNAANFGSFAFGMASMVYGIGFHTAGNQPPLVLWKDQIGDAITLPLFTQTAGGAVLSIVEVLEHEEPYHAQS